MFRNTNVQFSESVGCMLSLQFILHHFTSLLQSWEMSQCCLLHCQLPNQTANLSLKFETSVSVMFVNFGVALKQFVRENTDFLVLTIFQDLFAKSGNFSTGPYSNFEISGLTRKAISELSQSSISIICL